MTFDVGGIPLPESLSGPCRRLRYHETNNSKVQKSSPPREQLHWQKPEFVLVLYSNRSCSNKTHSTSHERKPERTRPSDSEATDSNLKASRVGASRGILVQDLRRGPGGNHLPGFLGLATVHAFISAPTVRRRERERESSIKNHSPYGLQ
jgi:hypothetical protein